MKEIDNIRYLQVNPENFCGIYCLYCLISKKYYIGSAKVFNRRKSAHLLRLKKNIHTNPHLQAAYNIYGLNNFVWLKLKDVHKDVIIQEEQKYLDLYTPFNNKIGYNISESAGRPKSTKGLKRPASFGENIRRLKTGSKHSEETKKVMREKKIGIPLSESHAQKISISHKKSGFKPNKYALECVSKANSKEYILVSPDNQIIKIKNLMRFARENNLNRTSLSLVYRGKYGKSNCYKGWKSVSKCNIGI